MRVKIDVKEYDMIKKGASLGVTIEAEGRDPMMIIMSPFEKDHTEPDEARIKKAKRKREIREMASVTNF